MFDGLSRDRLERYIFSLTDDAFSRVVHQAAEGSDISEENLRSIASFCRYAFIGFVMQFFWNGMENDIDESVDRLGTLFDSFWLFRIRNNQNLSQIGNRAGLAGEKSSLFFHAIRIIREMREATNGIFPAIAVWENVIYALQHIRNIMNRNQLCIAPP